MRGRAGVGELELRERPMKGEQIAGEVVELDDRSVARALRTIAFETPEHTLRSLLLAANRRYELDPRPLAERLRVAVARGELVFVRTGVVTVSGTRPQPPVGYVPPPAEEEEPVDWSEELDWIEILVADQDGRPMREIGYEITLPDGAVRRGRTTREGVVRLDEIPKGECKFALTDFDESAYEDEASATG